MLPYDTQQSTFEPIVYTAYFFFRVIYEKSRLNQFLYFFYVKLNLIYFTFHFELRLNDMLSIFIFIETIPKVFY